MTPYAFLVADNAHIFTDTSVMLVPALHVHAFPWQLSFLFRIYLATVPTNMVAHMWNIDRKAVFVKIIDVLDGVAAPPQEPVMQEADPEPLELDSELPADPEPISYDILEPDDYDEAQVLHIIRMWSGFDLEFITDKQMLASLGFDYPDADILDWVMAKLGVLVAMGDVTVDEFVLALQYVLENS